MTADGPLELSIVVTSDDGRERVEQRMDNVAHVLVQRRAEVEALKAQQAKLLAAMEEVPFCMPSAHHFPTRVAHHVLHT